MTTYIALTLGPIYKTFANVRKTRELWAASYMFSYLMRETIKNLKRKGIKDNDIIIPFVNKAAEDYKGVGIFPDRLIFKSKQGDYDKLSLAFQDAVRSLASYFTNSTNAESFLKEYLRMIAIEKELPAGANIIEEMFTHLDSLELMNLPLSQEILTQNVLADFFTNVNKPNHNRFFTENNYDKENSLAMKDINGNIRFESLMEIASSHFKSEKPEDYKDLVKHLWNNNQGDVDDKETDFITELKKAAGDKFKPHHKYIAIIKADGDKIGSAIKELNGDIDKLQKFSEALFNWAVSCDKAVRIYGAIPIYIGGDDLLMFAPISYGDKNIFDLIDAIDKSFTDAMKDYKGVSLSYGISITYYKFPLFEAVTKVDDLLLQAKRLSDNRNAVAIRVLKHSGSVLETSFEKGDNPNTFQIIKDVLHAIDENLETKEKSFLNSVGYFLRDNYKTIELIWFNKIRIENFFKNNFEDYVTDEELHLKGGKNLKRATKAEYLYKTKNLIEHIFLVKMPKNTEETEAALTEIYSIIRICRFIKGLEDEK